MKRKKAAKKKSWFVRTVMILLIMVAIIGGGGYLFITSWIQKFLRSDECRRMIAQQIGRAAGAECELEPLTWNGSSVYSPRLALDPSTAAGWKDVEADGVRASLDWGGVRRGVWSVPSINFDSVRLRLADAPKPVASAASEDRGVVDLAPVPAPPTSSGWLQNWLPKKVEIGEVVVGNFDLKPGATGDVSISGMELRATPATDEGAWNLKGNDGRLMIPALNEPFRLGRTSARMDARSLALNDVQARWLGESEVTGRGSFPFGGTQGWSFSGRVSHLDLKHLLSDDWKPNLTGSIEGDYDVAGGSGNAVSFKGKLTARNAVIQNLHVQHLIADHTHTERFRRIVWDEAHADIETQGARTRISNLVLQSNGLLRIEGAMTIEAGAVDGNFLMGVSPETMTWKGGLVADTTAGAARRVFTEAHPGGRPGFLWTNVQVWGKPGDIREDLSKRLAWAMGIEVAEKPLHVAGKGVEILGKTGEAVIKSGTDAGREVINGAGQVIDKGLDTVKGLIPRF